MCSHGQNLDKSWARPGQGEETVPVTVGMRWQGKQEQEGPTQRVLLQNAILDGCSYKWMDGLVRQTDSANINTKVVHSS